MLKRNLVSIVIFISVLCVLFFTLFSCQTKDTLSNVVEKVMPNVTEITCKEEGKFNSVGTAFFIDDIYLATNAHVVTYKEADEYHVYNEIYIINKGLQYSANLVEFDITTDVAILKINDKVLTKNIRFYVQTLKYAESVYTIGNLNAYGLACNNGIVSAPQKIIVKNGKEQCYIQTNIEISEGSSGAPLFNSKGQIIGMMTFKLRDSNAEYVDGLSFAIPISRVLTMYENNISNLQN